VQDNKLLGTQTLSAQSAPAGEELFADQAQFGTSPVVNTVYTITKGGIAATPGTDYSVTNGKLTFLTVGVYKVTMTNEAIISSTTNPAKVEVDITVDMVPVTNITNVPTTAIAGTPLTLSGTVEPTNATYKDITWSVINANGTGAVITDTAFTATAAGTATIKATITDGTAMGTPYTEEFQIVVSLPFVAVTDIINVPTATTVGTSLPLSGDVMPTNATNKTITWSVVNANGTGATINDSVFRATAAGTALIKATIVNGKAIGTDYEQLFMIEVGGTGVEELGIRNYELGIYPNPTRGQLTINNEQLTMNNIEIYDVMGRLLQSDPEFNSGVNLKS
jgi:endo-1,4-beta-xylanase